MRRISIPLHCMLFLAVAADMHDDVIDSIFFCLNFITFVLLRSVVANSGYSEGRF